MRTIEEIVEEILEYDPEEIIEEFHEDLKEILKIHKAEQQKWIPVDERLPENSEATYLICTDGGYMCSCRWTNDRYGLGSHPGSDWGWHKMDKPQFGKIVAWMPLKPYKA